MSSQLVKWRCPICGIEAYVPEDTPRITCCRCHYRQLGGVKAGLGDIIAAILHSFGITIKRYRNFKAFLGLEPVCKCPEKQSRLNTFGRKIKIG